MSQKYLFWPDVYKEQGHWIPTLNWAQQLYDGDGENPSHIVEYMGITDCAEIINSYPIDDSDSEARFNFETIFSNIYPKGYTTESHSSPNERWRPDHIWAIAYSALDNLEVEYVDKLNPKLYADAVAFKNTMAKIAPHFLISGYFTSLESLLIHKIYDIPVILSTTYLRHPSEDPAMRALQNLKAFSRSELYKLINLVEHKIDSLEEPEPIFEPDDDVANEDADALTTSAIKEFVDPIRHFVQALENFKELIPCPREYEFSHYQMAGELVKYVDPCITNEFVREKLNSEGKLTDEDGVVWIGDAQEPGILDKDNLIYVTAGSQVLDYEGKARHLFHAMCDAMSSAELSEYHLILGVGKKLVNDYEWYEFKNSPNITIAGWVPQRAILSSPKLKFALIHGGLATIKECVYFNKPFLILPMGKDQMDNALRLRKYGINNTYQISQVSATGLVNAIFDLDADKKSKDNLAKLSQIFNEAENAKLGYKQILEMS